MPGPHASWVWHDMQMNVGIDEWPIKSDPFTLRFAEPGLEAEFVQHRGSELASRLFVGGAGVLALCASLLVGSGDQAQLCTAALELARRRQLVLCSVATLSTLIMALMKAPRLLEAIGAAACELGAVCVFVAITIAVCYTEPYYMAKLHGLDPSVVFAGSFLNNEFVLTDTRLLLAVDTIVTVSHLLLPIRWCVLWPVDCVVILAYAVMVAAVGSPERGSATCNLAMLAVLSLGTMLGKRRIECHERLLFGSFRRDGSFTDDGSFEAEAPLHELSTSGDQETGEIRDIDCCSVPSVPTTTHTGRMFAELERVDSEVRWKLERIADIGHKERWLIEAAQVRLMPDCILGSGSFGVVVLASLHGSRVAVKVPRSSVNGSTAWHLPSLGNELRILRHVRHPNVVLFHGACIDPTSSELAVVLEHVQGQRLDRYLECAQPEPRTDTERHRILVDICCALRYLHGQRPCVVHGDLKASNILVEDYGNKRPCPKLVDFGLSRLLTRKAKPLGGTLNWMAPELLQNPGMSPAQSADVFSFGRLAYFVTTGIRPLADVDRRTLVKMARKARTPPLHWPEKSPFLWECQALVHRCLEIDAGLRPHTIDVHHELVQWRPKSCSSEDVAGEFAHVSPYQEDESLSWRSGLRMVRESLRPVPPNRLGSAPTTPSRPLVAAGANSSEDLSSENKPIRWERPLPPPRPQPQASRALPQLPKLPPVFEGETESTTRHSKMPGMVEVAEGEAADDSDGNAAQQSSLVLPERLETPAAMMEISIIDAIQRWNFARPAATCCDWHAAIGRLAKVNRGLRSHPCNKDFAPVRDWQCPRCLLMDQLDEDEPLAEKGCDLCGYDPAVQAEEQEVEEVAHGEDEEDSGEIQECAADSSTAALAPASSTTAASAEVEADEDVDDVSPASALRRRSNVAASASAVVL